MKIYDSIDKMCVICGFAIIKEQKLISFKIMKAFATYSCTINKYVQGRLKVFTLLEKADPKNSVGIDNFFFNRI